MSLASCFLGFSTSKLTPNLSLFLGGDPQTAQLRRKRLANSKCLDMASLKQGDSLKNRRCFIALQSIFLPSSLLQAREFGINEGNFFLGLMAVNDQAKHVLLAQIARTICELVCLPASTGFLTGSRIVVRAQVTIGGIGTARERTHIVTLGAERGDAVSHASSTFSVCRACDRLP